ncbi:MAG: hypothetical protein HUU46_08240 [Candidatus Hydrogenedentes bacterium]|nr:hypothetical protein [Candidatus Hydrogenedentota bacterium]
MNRKVKALIWEECRVGGAIAGWCVFLSAVYLACVKWPEAAKPNWTMWNDIMVAPFSLGMPVLIALLLILNPNQSGHMVGGYSKRVLWLPVPTSVAVAVTLALRTLFIFLSAIVLMVVSGAVFEGAPTATLVLFFVFLYLAAQLLDWLRDPISGLSSAIVVGVMAAVVILIARGSDVADAIGSVQAPAWGASLALVAMVLAAAYGVSVFAVHAARVGWRVGVPEIWEWPRRIEIGKTRALRVFSSPVAAQFWFELRQSKWVLPLGTAVVSLLIILTIGAVWISGTGSASEFRLMASLAPFPALLLAAAAHGIVTRVLGFRKTHRTAGFQYVQPLTCAEMATAKTLANIAMLLPTVIVITILHAALAGGTFLSEVIPFAYSSGAANAREIAWVLVSRGILIGLIAWPLAAVGARVVLYVVTLVMSTPLIMVALLELQIIEYPHDLPQSWQSTVTFHFALWIALSGAILLCIGAFWRAWRTRTIPLRAVAGWGCAWVLAAWLLHAALPDSLPDDAKTYSNYALLVLMCLGYASLVPLPYAAIALDVARRRHGVVNAQDAAQHAMRPRRRPARMRIAVGMTALFAIWLGWRGEPTYLDYLRGRGWPATLAELDASYAAVPDSKNVALKYLAVNDQQLKRSGLFYYRTIYRDDGTGESGKRNPPTGAALYEYAHEELSDRIVAVGKAKVPDSGPIPDDVWQMSEAYWNDVTTHIVPRLKAIAESGPQPSRYPVELSDGYWAQLEHLGELRWLGRELSLDTLHWAMHGDAQEAQRAVLAFFPLQDSLRDEPLAMSQRTRIGILSNAIDALEIAMNRAALTDDHLDNLRQGFAHTLQSLEEGAAMDVTLRGERTMAVSVWDELHFLGENDLETKKYMRSRVDPTRIALGLAISPTAECMAVLYAYSNSGEAPSTYVRRRILRDSPEVESLFAPMSAIVMPSFRGFQISDAQIRMQIEIALAAIAVEQFRRAEGRLPIGLDELIPTYLEAAPADYYAHGRPVRYVPDGAGGFVIYSIGRNGIDDGGREEPVERNDYDDLAFRVAAHAAIAGEASDAPG